MTRKPRVTRAGAPSRYLPGWFVITDNWNHDRRFETWTEALAYALALATVAEATA